ncbi:hypothetical protein BH20ACT5_BH20ACT5_23220 [soil metagenome]
MPRRTRPLTHRSDPTSPSGYRLPSANVQPVRSDGTSPEEPSWVWALTGGIALLAGCTASDPYAVVDEPAAAEARQAAQQRIDAALDRAGGGVAPVAQATRDSCDVGQNTWKVREDYRVRCMLGRADVHALQATDEATAQTEAQDVHVQSCDADLRFPGAGQTGILCDGMQIMLEIVEVSGPTGNRRIGALPRGPAQHIRDGGGRPCRLGRLPADRGDRGVPPDAGRRLIPACRDQVHDQPLRFRFSRTRTLTSIGVPAKPKSSRRRRSRNRR